MRISLWSPQYLVHDAEIDRQHQALFEPANRLHEAMLLGKGKEVLAEIVERAKRLVSEHNAYEERLMKDTHYPEYQEHVQQHAELARKARFLLERFECGETTMTIELALFFSPSIKHHVMKHDRRLAEYLNARSSAPLFDGRVGSCDTQRHGMSQVIAPCSRHPGTAYALSPSIKSNYRSLTGLRSMPPIHTVTPGSSSVGRY
jgi:hemerythrin